ncbi:cytochrome P450 [Zychaea mexicana]|uniref:cytochrome P450 n=1 Tax=Zychaea mexicana TaxID=64656 RepID=UPI0022FF2A8E|nr:cytochrome P450 [Zychaea mexicana]KAI9499051.1 cytochrome P450 [Zychaea mexicana]
MDFETLSQKLESSAHHVVDRVLSANRQDVEKVGKIAAITLATYVVSSKIYDAFVGPLSGIPGPFQFKFYSARWSRQIEDPPGAAYTKYQAWQTKYGEVVRLGPNTIGVADKQMLRQILFKDDIPKGPAYKRLQRQGGGTLFSTVDKIFHKQRRRVISPAFSVKYLNSLEPYMLKTTESFIGRIDKDIANTNRGDGFGQVDVWILLQYLALDIIGETAFGQTFHMLDGNDHIVPATITRNMETANYLVTHPLSGAIKTLFSFSDIMQQNDKLKQFMKKIIVERLEGGEKARRDDILQILIDTQHAHDTEDRLTADAIAQETVLFLIAGSETTSNTTGFAMIELMKHPQALATLREEIDSVQMEDGQKLFKHEQLKHLPYLNAVINESMRKDSIAVNGLERTTDRDMILGGRLMVPKGTVIHCNLYHAHMNPKYWPEPNEFKPERWLEGSDIPADQEAFFPFSIGSRNCIGKAFAQQEMRLSIANLIRLYDFEAIPSEMKRSDDRRSFITYSVTSNSFNVYMKRRATTA